MTRNDDPAVIALMVDRLLAQARTPATPAKPVTPPTAKTATPAKKSPNPAPLKKAPTEGAKPVKNSAKPKPFARTRRTPTPKPKPKAWVELAPGANLSMEMPFTSPKFSHPTTPARSAHYLERGEVAPCFVCGGEADEKADHWGPWRRHDECTRITQPWERVRAAAEWYAIPATDNECWSADIVVADFADQHASAVYSKNDADRTAWSHVSRTDVDRAITEARRALAEVDEPKACELGVCGWCGVEKSSDWTDAGHVRADNSKAPLCASCSVVFDKIPGDHVAHHWDDQRVGLAEALSGVVPDLLETFPSGLKAHAEVGGGDGAAWSHLPAAAVEEFRWAYWGRAGGRYAPEEHRAEAVARAAALEADRGARMDALATADPYGFSEGT